jgi:hypothetical protein
MEDLIEQANEVQESLGRSYGVPDQIDEDELQAGQYIIQKPSSLLISGLQALIFFPFIQS